jgi:hypothetical protein
VRRFAWGWSPGEEAETRQEIGMEKEKEKEKEKVQCSAYYIGGFPDFMLSSNNLWNIFLSPICFGSWF